MLVVDGLFIFGGPAHRSRQGAAAATAQSVGLRLAGSFGGSVRRARGVWAGHRQRKEHPSAGRRVRQAASIEFVSREQPSRRWAVLADSSDACVFAKTSTQRNPGWAVWQHSEIIGRWATSVMGCTVGNRRPPIFLAAFSLNYSVAGQRPAMPVTATSGDAIARLWAKQRCGMPFSHRGDGPCNQVLPVMVSPGGYYRSVDCRLGMDNWESGRSGAHRPN